MLGWLAFPIAATFAAIVWVLWVSRPRPPADMSETLQDFRRFTTALEGAAGWSDRHGEEPAPEPSAEAAEPAEPAPPTAEVDQDRAGAPVEPLVSPSRRVVAPVDHGPVRQHGLQRSAGAVRGRDSAGA